ncbi:MAG TPA: hypothetical protein VGN60_07505 [Devosia sp.]|jgi:hypothetical protein|nr:hypothetical protein [Devosia sp.]
MAVIRGFESAGVVACFVEAAGGGDIFDINAPCNAPAKDPINYLSSIIWHSALDQFELAAGPTDVPIAHASLAPGSTLLGIGAVGLTVHGNTRVTDILLLTHNLGYKPRVKVTIAGKVVTSGQMIQDSTQYRRTVSVFTTTTGVYLRETAFSSDVSLPAHNQTYRVFVFRQATADPAQPLFGKAGSLMTLARGIVRSDGRYLRRTGVGDAQEFSMDSGPTLDVSNGHKRVANGGVLTTEAGYNGSMAAPAYATVGL